MKLHLAAMLDEECAAKREDDCNIDLISHIGAAMVVAGAWGIAIIYLAALADTPVPV